MEEVVAALADANALFAALVSEVAPLAPYSLAALGAPQATVAPDPPAADPAADPSASASSSAVGAAVGGAVGGVFVLLLLVLVVCSHATSQWE